MATLNLRDWNTKGAGPKMDVGPMPARLRGITVQPYLDKVPGGAAAAKLGTLAPALRRWAGLGAVAWAPHGFTTTLPADVPAYVAAGAAAGLATVPAFGLNEDDPAGKGERMAVAARAHGVAAIICDEEGAWEGHAAAFDSAQAVAEGMSLTSSAPGVVVIHQPWPVPQVHKEWPLVAFARFSSAIAPQFYYNDWSSSYGKTRYRTLEPRFTQNWSDVERDVLRACGLGGIPLVRTVQGYGWHDIPYDCATCFVAHETLIVWSEWAPEPEVERAMEVRRRLNDKVGLYFPDSIAWDGGTAVERFQRAYNEKAPRGRLLSVDGAYGPATEAALFESRIASFAGAVARRITG